MLHGTLLVLAALEHLVGVFVFGLGALEDGGQLFLVVLGAYLEDVGGREQAVLGLESLGCQLEH